MILNTTYLSTTNSYDVNDPLFIVVHNTDNYAGTANAKQHALAQSRGNIKGASAHVYVDDAEAYQVIPFTRGAWHVGANYGGKIFGVCHNRNSIGVEMCVNAGYAYEKAFLNTVEVVRELMKNYKIPADHVVSHYDVCAKNCPSEIRKRKDWKRFLSLLDGEIAGNDAEAVPHIDKLYRLRESWLDGKTQIGAYTKLENAKAAADLHPGYTVYDWEGNAVYTAENVTLVKGSEGRLVKEMQEKLIFCGFYCGSSGADGDFGVNTAYAVKEFKVTNGLNADAIYDKTTKETLEHFYSIVKIYREHIEK